MTFPKLTAEEMTDWARTHVEKVMPGDEIAQAKVESAILGTYRSHQIFQREQTIQDNDTLAGAMDPDENGKWPMTREELLAKGPDVQTAWDRATVTKQRQILSDLVKGPVKTSDLGELQRLWGMVHGAQEQQEDFVFKENLEHNPKLSYSDRKSLIQERQRLVKNPTDDIRVKRAIGWLQSSRPDLLTANGLGERTKDNKNDYDRFVGGMHFAMEDWSKAHNGLTPPPEAVIKEIGPMFLAPRFQPAPYGPPGWQKILGVSRPSVFKEDIDPVVYQQIASKFFEANGYMPSVNEIYLTYYQAIFHDFYESGKKRGPR
jgi:hypothetical protein